MKRLSLLALFPVMASAQVFSWTGAPITITPGTPFTASLQVTAPANGWAGVAWNLQITGGAINSVQLAAALTADGKYLTCNAASTECVVIGAGTLGADVLSDQAVTGTQMVATYTINPQAESVTITVNAAQMTDPGAASIATTLPAAFVIPPPPPPSPCAVTGDSTVGLIDVVTELDWALSITQPPSGKTPARIATDVPPYLPSIAIVLQAALGGQCLATQ